MEDPWFEPEFGECGDEVGIFLLENVTCRRFIRSLLQGIMKSGLVTLTATASHAAPTATLTAGVKRTPETAGD